jgi:hypothetical protein
MIEFIENGNINMEAVYIHPIWADIHSHYINNKLSLIYIYDIQSGRELVVNIGNTDHHTTHINHLTFDFKEAFVFGKKSFLNLIQLPYMYDADLIKYLQVNEQLKRNQTSCHSFFYRKFHNVRGVNNLIPIGKHIESIRKTKDEFLQHYDSENGITEEAKKFDNFYIKSLHDIEKNGLYTSNGIEHSQYNIYTTTSRPSNTFNGVNYAALNKEDGSRSRFISRFDGGKLIQFDYDAYHPRIIGKMVGEPISNDVSGHQVLADMYGVSYNESKAITFRQLYGGVQDEYLHIPLFQKTSHWIDLNWMEFNRNGYVKTPMGRTLKKGNFKNMNANKLFNYMLQATETELNVRIISKINGFLKDKKTKLMLYTYDSYLLDVHPKEFSLLNHLKILIEGNGFKSKVEMGDNYSEMNPIEIENKQENII